MKYKLPLFISLLVVTSITVFAFGNFDSKEVAALDKDMAAINETGRRVRKAFLEGDIDTILKYHHPEVEKVFSWDNYQKGHADMRKALTELFANNKVRFIDSAAKRESVKINGDTAILIQQFGLEGTPKAKDAEPWVYGGRTMLVMIRDKRSPTGWVTIREMVVEKK